MCPSSKSSVYIIKLVPFCLAGSTTRVDQCVNQLSINVMNNRDESSSKEEKFILIHIFSGFNPRSLGLLLCIAYYSQSAW